jgi:hypothetical protein
VNGLGVRSTLRALFAPSAAAAPVEPPAAPLAALSRFAHGDWVRVRDAAQVRATLDAGDRLRGLRFVPAHCSSSERSC